MLPDLKLMKVEVIKPQLKIAFDIDGVLADIHTPWLTEYNRDYGDNLTVENINEWNMHKIVSQRCGTKIYDYLTPGLYLNTPAFEGALDTVTKARLFGRVIFVTTPTTNTFGVKFNWLQAHGFSPSIKDYVECGDKSLINADVL